VEAQKTILEFWAERLRPATKLKALPRERVTKALAHLGPPYRDALELQA